MKVAGGGGGVLAWLRGGKMGLGEVQNPQKSALKLTELGRYAALFEVPYFFGFQMAI